ncbi:MAG: selenide, water dikinase SelD [Leptolyngbyaceae cyanobacterium bins.349]|nr:selenide, water dikinase SelD [Leptolyngbyaceae cyanobacterium bins.349]
MRTTVEPVTQELVLVGGGHTHAIALRLFGMKPLNGIRLTLISEASESAYSGMLPGRVAGFYTDEECHVNLSALAEFAGAQFYVDRVTGVDLEQRRIICDRHPPVAFDVLSLDIGSTPTLLPEAHTIEQVLPAKPVRQFLDQWDQLTQRLSQHPDQPMRLAIVGGGAGGVELAFTMQRRLHTLLQAAGQPLSHLHIHLIHRGAQLAPQLNNGMRDRLYALLAQRQIHLHLNETVQTVEPNLLRCASGLELPCDAIVWVTHAAAPAWLTKTGLALDDRGFIQVQDTLQSVSHPFVFAAGDIATLIHHPRPKAGVFAVRQGKPLADNLRRFCHAQPLNPFRPQKHYLSLINTADGQAIAVRGRWGWRSPLLWRWKDHIDRTFMARLNNLPDMTGDGQTVGGRRLGPKNSQSVAAGKTAARQNLSGPLIQSVADPQADAGMHCAGCGSKVGSTVLARVLQRLQPDPPLSAPGPSTAPVASVFSGFSAPVLIGLAAPDDAAVFSVPAGKVIVQTVDYFAALLNDPFVFGQISANHALSDVYAMGAEPHSALAIATVPYGHPANVEESLYQLLSGAVRVLQEAGATLIGGHSTEGAELAFGLSCNGLAEADALLRKGNIQPGQALILTKPLGTGTLFAAKMQRLALGRWVDGAVASMLRSNAAASQCFLQFGATACTDITGFGLVGHLLEMMQATNIAVTLKLDAVPALEGALTTLERGIVSSLQAQNLHATQWIDKFAPLMSHPKFQLLFDPQTSGGLLAAIPLSQEASCLAQLKALGYSQSCTIGYTQPQVPGQLPLAIA